MKTLIAIVIAGIATVAIASNCSTSCNTIGGQTTCTTTCYDRNGHVRTCTESCVNIGGQPSCTTTCYPY
jgi:hypothetical protein